jgi:iron complex transport system substrate-binding protein
MTSHFLPTRIVSLQPSATVILSELGALGRVVACTRYCGDLVPEVRLSGRVLVADSWTAQASQIRTSKPDLVIAAVPYQERALAEIMKAGVRFLGLAPHSLADVFGDIALIAAAVGEQERGQALIARMRNEIEDVRKRTSSLPRRRIFCEEWGKPLIASQPWVAELAGAAGGDFVGEPGKQTTSDSIRAQDPDVLIAAWCGAGDRVPLERIVRQRGWENLAAVREGRVFCIRDDYLNTPAPSLLAGLHALVAAIHPEHFPQAEGLRRISCDTRLPTGSAC